MSKKIKQSLPLSTQWTLDAVNVVGKTIIPYVFLVLCKDTGSKGTGFLLANGYVITNLHVITGKLENIVLVSYDGQEIKCQKWYFDINKKLDLIILIPQISLSGGLELSSNEITNIGTPVHTWGYPLGYQGPAPLLSVGYLAGFKEFQYKGSIFRHLVVNGAFNKGNSGGPLFRADDNKVIGVVVSKHVPLSDAHASGIQALAANPHGVTFTRVDQKGNKKTISKSQMIADILLGYRDLIQVMIGEAICISELLTFLKAMALSIYHEGMSKKELEPDNSIASFQEAKRIVLCFFPNDPLLVKIEEQLARF